MVRDHQENPFFIKNKKSDLNHICDDNTTHPVFSFYHIIYIYRVHMLLLAIVVGLSTDWQLEARNAKERVAKNNNIKK